MTDVVSNLWLVRPRPRTTPAFRLFCLPYAGAGSYLFHAWPRSLPTTVEICAVELPGRGRRFREPPAVRLQTLVDEILVGLQRYADAPYALFGHSLGALLSFELARQCRRGGAGGPVHLFVSGHRAPHIPDDDVPLHTLPDGELIERLRRWNGTPEALLGHEEVMQAMLPVLRADLEVSDTYRYQAAPSLDCPITVFGGTEDPTVSVEHLEAWREHTSSAYARRLFEGGHFFLQTDQAHFLSTLADELNAVGSRLLVQAYARSAPPSPECDVRSRAQSQTP